MSALEPGTFRPSRPMVGARESPPEQPSREGLALLVRPLNGKAGSQRDRQGA